MCKMVRLKTNQNQYVRVAENKRDCISNIIQAAERCKHINGIILFGSSLEERCQEDSDIDIAIISDITKSRLFQSKSYDEFINAVYLKKIGQFYDIIVFYTEDSLRQGKSSLNHEILSNGKVIYSKGAA